MLDQWKTAAMLSTLDSKFSQFVTGILTPFRAIQLIFEQPKLLTLSLAPILIAVFLFALIIYGLLAGVWAFVHSAVLATVSAYSGIIFVLISALILCSLAFFAVSFLTFMMSLAASPFNDILAEQTERALKIEEVPHWSAGRFLRVFWIDLRKTVLTLFTGIIFSLGMLIPVANILFFVGLALLHTFTFITYPQSRREQGLFQSLLWVKEHFFVSLGFGLITVLLFSIPVIDFFALPISVVGGTLLFCDSIKARDRVS